MTKIAADTAALVREAGSSSIRVPYDQANLTFTHDEPPLAVQGDLIAHTHAKDLVFTDPDAAFRASETAKVTPT